MQLYLNIITTQQRRKWNSEKLQDHVDCWSEKENSDLWKDLGPVHSPWNRKQGMDLLCSSPPPPPGSLALQVSFLSLHVLGVGDTVAISQNLFYLYFTGQHARALNRIDSTLS